MTLYLLALYFNCILKYEQQFSANCFYEFSVDADVVNNRCLCQKAKAIDLSYVRFRDVSIGSFILS